jgi:uncharacterized RDD family membrane protein YckC
MNEQGPTRQDPNETAATPPPDPPMPPGPASEQPSGVGFAAIDLPAAASATPPSAPPPPVAAFVPQQTAAPQPQAVPQPPVAWAPPAPSRPLVPGAPSLEFGSVPIRFAAYFLDTVLVAIGSVVVSAILFRVPGGQIITELLVIAYFAAWWSGGRRATPAQRLLQLQVGNAFDGRALTTDQALRRAAILELDGIVSAVLSLVLPPGTVASLSLVLGLLWAIAIVVSTATSPTRQGLHDRFAGTAVVRPVNPQSNDAAIIIVVVLVVVVAIPALAIVALIFLGSQVSDILSSVGSSI